MTPLTFPNQSFELHAVWQSCQGRSFSDMSSFSILSFACIVCSIVHIWLFTRKGTWYLWGSYLLEATECMVNMYKVQKSNLSCSIRMLYFLPYHSHLRLFSCAPQSPHLSPAHDTYLKLLISYLVHLKISISAPCFLGQIGVVVFIRYPQLVCDLLTLFVIFLTPPKSFCHQQLHDTTRRHQLFPAINPVLGALQIIRTRIPRIASPLTLCQQIGRLKLTAR